MNQRNYSQMKSRICLLGLLLLSACALSQSNSQDSLWIVENYYKIERQVAMRDGVKLFTSIYIPKDSTKSIPY